ncbi:hypothetical protein COLO4_05984 [Corchorus olitorius]|uniref:Uncharacterized protein n=1 Tax=Corchorus olitorius TaxID=93759 RepID=A0A1R3KPE3_9ROSI|nr:hypothetical protein COLO4_05984 [Corchorus olitorius]
MVVVSERLCEIRMKAGVFLVYGMCDEGNCEQQEMSSENGDKREWYLVELSAEGSNGNGGWSVRFVNKRERSEISRMRMRMRGGYGVNQNCVWEGSREREKSCVDEDS